MRFQTLVALLASLLMPVRGLGQATNFVSDLAGVLNAGELAKLEGLVSAHNESGPGRIRVLIAKQLPANTTVEAYAKPGLTNRQRSRERSWTGSFAGGDERPGIKDRNEPRGLGQANGGGVQENHRKGDRAAIQGGEVLRGVGGGVRCGGEGAWGGLSLNP